MPDTRKAYDNKLEVSATIPVQLRLDESRTSVSFGVVSNVVVSVLLGTSSLDRIIKPIHPAEKMSLTTPRWYQH